MSRHGKRAPGKTLLSVAIDGDLKDCLRILAKAERRTLSNFVAKKLEEMADEERKAKPPNQGSHHSGVGPATALSA